MKSFNSILKNIQLVLDVIPNKKDEDLKNVISYMLKDLREASNLSDEYQQDMINLIKDFINI